MHPCERRGAAMVDAGVGAPCAAGHLPGGPRPRGRTDALAPLGDVNVDFVAKASLDRTQGWLVVTADPGPPRSKRITASASFFAPAAHRGAPQGRTADLRDGPPRRRVRRHRRGSPRRWHSDEGTARSLPQARNRLKGALGRKRVTLSTSSSTSPTRTTCPGAHADALRARQPGSAATTSTGPPGQLRPPPHSSGGGVS